MMEKNDTVYRAQILDAIAKVESFVGTVHLDAFTENQEKQSAVILQLIIIGELSKHLSDSFKSQYNMPWKQIAGLRDRAVHDYFSLDVEQLWKTVQEDIPVLKKALSV
ncbi:MAG: DUF86 domain-containing protein [Patescibacteria group bacterium]